MNAPSLVSTTLFNHRITFPNAGSCLAFVRAANGQAKSLVARCERYGSNHALLTMSPEQASSRLGVHEQLRAATHFASGAWS